MQSQLNKLAHMALLVAERLGNFLNSSQRMSACRGWQLLRRRRRQSVSPRNLSSLVSLRPKERKKERKKSLCPHTRIKYIQHFACLSEYDYIRKMLNKIHLGKVRSKAAER